MLGDAEAALAAAMHRMTILMPDNASDVIRLRSGVVRRPAGFRIRRPTYGCERSEVCGITPAVCGARVARACTRCRRRSSASRVAVRDVARYPDVDVVTHQPRGAAGHRRAARRAGE